MKLSELILELLTIMLEKGNLTVYIDTEQGVEDPAVALAEGGGERWPYPGVYVY